MKIVFDEHERKKGFVNITCFVLITLTIMLVVSMYKTSDMRFDHPLQLSF
jgi:hypothetical protein